jgi:integrase
MVDSYLAANEWWKAKRLELDTAARPQRQPWPLETLAVAAMGGGPGDDVATTFAKHFIMGEPRQEAMVSVQSVAVQEALRLLAVALQGGELPSSLTPADAKRVTDAVTVLQGDAPPSQGTGIGELADRWLDSQKMQVDLGKLAPARWGVLRTFMGHWRTFVGNKGIADVDASLLRTYFDHLAAKVTARRNGEADGWSTAYAKECFGAAKRFLQWTKEEGYLASLPSNLDSRQLTFGSTLHNIETWTVEEVRRVIGEAPGQLRLCLLLMANCGMTQVDISDLADSEVDWQHGRIKRRRSKTKDKASTPIVDYKLWPLTFELLRKYRSGGAKVLVSETGKPLVNKRMEAGKLKCADLVAANYTHLKRRLHFAKPLKQLRKTSASMLASHETYGRFVDLFLGHSPRSMAERHYSAPPQVLFDAGVLWLGSQFGLAE